MGRVSSVILSILIALLVLFTVAGNHGLMELIHLSGEIAMLNSENRELESEIVDIQNKIYGVSNSDLVLEQRAREQLGLSKPGEIVYIFSQANSRTPENSTSSDEQSEVPPKE